MSTIAGELALGQEKFDVAELHFETALAIFAEVVGPEHPMNFETLISLGEAKAGLGRPDEAIGWYHRALGIAPAESATARPLLGIARASTDPADVHHYGELARVADPFWDPHVDALFRRTPI